jgi:hypothetical protein
MDPLTVQDTIADFSDRSHLTYFIPSQTSAEVEDVFQDLEQGKPLLESIEKRSSLFFGKSA